MKHSNKILLAAFVVAMLCLHLLPLNSDAQGADDDRVIIKTDYQLLGFGELHGGGHVTFELRGRAAGDLRRAVLAEYDYGSNGLIDPPDLWTSSAEGYIADICNDLTNNLYFFFASDPHTFRPLHHTRNQIEDDAQGFTTVTDIATNNREVIRIYLYFDVMAGTSVSGDGFNLLAQGFLRALYDPLDDNRLLDTGEIDFRRYTFQYKHSDYRISMGSMYGLSLSNGHMHVIRTPAGEVSFYNVAYDAIHETTFPVMVDDTATYKSFSFFESPQILFILVFVCSYLLATMPTRIYAGYKYAYPRRYRHKAVKISWLHIIGKVLIIFLFLFYFFPTMFAFISPSFFLSGLGMWILCILLTLLICIGAKLLYDHKIANIPKEYLSPPVRRVPARPVPVARTTTTPAGVSVYVQQQGAKQVRPEAVGAPVAAPVAVPMEKKKDGPPCEVCKKPILGFTDLTKCKCGKLYHEECAETAQNCISCGLAFGEAEEPEEVTKSIQCPTCGEMNTVPEQSDLIRENCKACGIMLERIERGYNYLVVDNDPRVAFQMFVSVLKQGSKGLSISTTFPDKLRKEHEMTQTDVIWLTDTSTPDQKTINPHRLEFEMMRMYASFVKTNKDSAVILDGFEYLVVENGFDKVFKFIKKVNDLSSVNTATLFVPIGVSSLEPDQLGTLKKEFDRVIVLADEDID